MPIRLGEVATVALGDRAHQARRPARARRRDEQVNVIAHQHVGVHGACAMQGALAQPSEVGDAVAVVRKARRAPEPTLHNVQRDTGFFGAGKARHGTGFPG